MHVYLLTVHFLKMCNLGHKHTDSGKILLKQEKVLLKKTVN